MVGVEVIAKTCLVKKFGPCALYWDCCRCIDLILADVEFLFNILLSAVVAVVKGNVGEYL